MAASFSLPCSYIVSTEVALLFGSVSCFGVLDKGVPSGIRHGRSMGKKIVLESLSSTFGTLAGTISTRNVLILHCGAPCPACALTP